MKGSEAVLRKRVSRRALEALWPALDRGGLMLTFDAESAEEARQLGDVFEAMCREAGYVHPPYTTRPDRVPVRWVP